MKRTISLSAALLLGSTGLALAGNETSEGKVIEPTTTATEQTVDQNGALHAENGTYEGEISGIDPDAETVTVDDSPPIHVPEREIVNLQMGQQVIIEAHQENGRLVSSNILPLTMGN